MGLDITHHPRKKGNKRNYYKRANPVSQPPTTSSPLTFAHCFRSSRKGGIKEVKKLGWGRNSVGGRCGLYGGDMRKLVAETKLVRKRRYWGGN